MIAGKVWGSTEPVIETPTFSMHKLIVKPNHRCSLHLHRHKWNAFLVTSGKLFIDVVKSDYPLTDTTELLPGQVTTVRPGEHHRFRTGDEPCEMFEMYYVEALSEDIERKDHGGKVVDES